MKNAHIIKCGLALALLMLVACSSASSGDDLVRLSYEGSEALLDQVSLGRDAVVIYGVFTPVGHVETSSPFGRIVAEQMASRMVQRGVRVVEVRLREEVALGQGGPFTLSNDARKVAGLVRARAVLTGSYATTHDYILLNARLLDVTTGIVLASWDKRIDIGTKEHVLLSDHSGPFLGMAW